MDIAVRAFDAADTATAERAYEIEAACVAADLPDFPPPDRRRFFGRLSHPRPGNEARYALAHRVGVPVGYLKVDLPQLDNTDNAEVEILVPPRHRRKGIGRALHEYAVELVRGQGRKRIFGLTVVGLPGGPPRDPAGGEFAATMGARSALTDIRRRLDVTTLDRAGLDGILADAWSRADGYSLVRWQGATPEEYIDDVAYLDSRLLEDAPMGDLAWEPEKVDADRVRASEAAYDAWGRRRYHTGMRHDGSGHLVAWTTLDPSASSPWHAFQGITIVEPRHRGHRLGAIIKIENLRYALANEPALRAVDTWNAAVNNHMIAINEAMGFRPVDGWDNWQLTL